MKFRCDGTPRSIRSAAPGAAPFGLESRSGRAVRLSFRFLCWFAFAACVRAGSAPAPARTDGLELESPGTFHFNLLPKAFSANPTLEMTVFTEFTEYGRTLPDASPGNPVYYVSHSKGFQSKGLPVGGEQPPPAPEIEQLLQQALMDRGYIPAEGSNHPPALALFYFWGTHAGVAVNDDFTNGYFPELRRQFIIEHAALVGGPAYAHRVAERLTFGAGPQDHTTKQDYLFYQADHDLYFVVVSAYAYEDVAQNKHRLAWRTTMTVNSAGVSLKETLPPLIVTAANYLGRPTDEAVALQRKVRPGSVSLGPLQVIEDNVTLPPPPRTK